MRKTVMRISFILCALLFVAVMTGCAKPAEEAAPTPAEASTPAPEPASTPAPAPAPEPAAEAKPAVVLPEGFAARFHVHPEMMLTSAETIDAAKGQYKVVGELRASAKEVLDYFVKYFQDNGWEEDAVMENEGTTVVSFKKDGYLEYIDSHEGGIGARITITTGQI